ncbi:altered inheritance of mitochondria protein 32 isoform X2 [Manihot esculenta]|uniref:altered inheritance of mitochondria protein 32 isoform X2 n=1 Tax=Manihot esculenta TaxID=3983 RepID=UPI001CC58505|nr:altered inheritance of mitochondria protein 32 isoform X2 [Manihot esculenta]
MRIAHRPRSLLPPALHFPSHSWSPNRILSFCSLPLQKPRTLALKRRRPERTIAAFAMADTEDISKAISAEEDAKFGFSRPEMYKSNLAGTVDQYDRHVFVCFRGPESWLPRVEETDLLPKLFSSVVKSRKDDIAIKTKITICEEREDTEFECGDVLIFPDMIKYKCLKDSDVDGFVDDVLVNGKQWTSAVQKLNGAYVFVCAHGSRDKRCGVCGPVLIEKLKEEIESRGLRDQVFVAACSHVGGHKYAGNLIVYSPDSEGKIMGHWYGYVTPDDVPEIFDQHIGQGIVIERIWRSAPTSNMRIIGSATMLTRVIISSLVACCTIVACSKKRIASNTCTWIVFALLSLFFLIFPRVLKLQLGLHCTFN